MRTSFGAETAARQVALAHPAPAGLLNGLVALAARRMIILMVLQDYLEGQKWGRGCFNRFNFKLKRLRAEITVYFTEFRSRT